MFLYFARKMKKYGWSDSMMVEPGLLGFLNKTKSFSLGIGCLFFCSLLRWSHITSIILRSGLWGHQSMTNSVPLCVFFYPGVLLLCWKCVCWDHSRAEIWSCSSPKLWQKLCCLLQMAADIHYCPSLLTSFVHFDHLDLTPNGTCCHWFSVQHLWIWYTSASSHFLLFLKNCF